MEPIVAKAAAAPASIPNTMTFVIGDNKNETDAKGTGTITVTVTEVGGTLRFDVTHSLADTNMAINGFYIDALDSSTESFLKTLTVQTLTKNVTDAVVGNDSITSTNKDDAMTDFTSGASGKMAMGSPDTAGYDIGMSVGATADLLKTGLQTFSFLLLNKAAPLTIETFLATAAFGANLVSLSGKATSAEMYETVTAYQAIDDNITIGGSKDGGHDSSKGGACGDNSSASSSTATGNVFANDVAASKAATLSVSRITTLDTQIMDQKIGEYFKVMAVDANGKMVKDAIVSMKIDATGAYTIDPAGTKALAAGETVYVRVGYQAASVDKADFQTSTASATMTIKIVGENDAPVTATKAISVMEDSATKGVLATDIDHGDKLTLMSVSVKCECAPSGGTSHDNNGFGNGDQNAPGNSGDHNNAENAGNVDATNYPGNSGHNGFSGSTFGNLPSSFGGMFGSSDNSKSSASSYWCDDGKGGHKLLGSFKDYSDHSSFVAADGKEYKCSADHSSFQGSDGKTCSLGDLFSSWGVKGSDGHSGSPADCGWWSGDQNGNKGGGDDSGCNSWCSDPITIGTAVAIRDVKGIATGATVTFNADATYLVDATRANALDAGQVVTETFNFTVKDLAGATLTDAVTVTVTGVNDVAQIADLMVAAKEDAVTTADLSSSVRDADAHDVQTFALEKVGLENVLDADGNKIDIKIDPALLAGQITMTKDGVLTVDASKGSFDFLREGDTAIVDAVVSATDTAGSRVSTIDKIFIQGSNDAATLTDVNISTTEGSVAVYDLAANIIDPDTAISDMKIRLMPSFDYRIFDAKGNLVDLKIDQAKLAEMFSLKGTELVVDTKSGIVDFLGEGMHMDVIAAIGVSDGYVETFGTATVSIDGANSQDSIKDASFATLEGQMVKGNLLDMAAPVDMNETFNVYSIEGQKVVWGSSGKLDTLETFKKIAESFAGDDLATKILQSYDIKAMLGKLGGTISDARDIVVYLKGFDVYGKFTSDELNSLDKVVAEIDKAAGIGGDPQPIDTAEAIKILIKASGLADQKVLEYINLITQKVVEMSGGKVASEGVLLKYFSQFTGDGVLNDKILSILKDTAAKLDMAGGSSGPDFLTFTLASGAILTLWKNGDFAYDAKGADTHLADGAMGKDGFSVQLVDHAGLVTDKGFVTIETTGLNTAPTFAGDTIATQEGAMLQGSLKASDVDDGATVTFDKVTIATKLLDVDAMLAQDKQDLVMLRERYMKQAGEISSKMKFYQEQLKQDQALLDEAQKKYAEASSPINEDMRRIQFQLTDLNQKLADAGYPKQLDAISAKYGPQIAELQKSIDAATADQNWDLVKQLSAKLDAVNAEESKMIESLQSQYAEIFTAMAKLGEAMKADRANLDKIYSEIVGKVQEAYNHDSTIINELQHKLDGIKMDYAHNSALVMDKINALTTAGDTVDFHAGDAIAFLGGAIVTFDALGGYVVNTLDMHELRAGDSFNADMTATFVDEHGAAASGNVALAINGVDDAVRFDGATINLAEGDTVGGNLGAVPLDRGDSAILTKVDVAMSAVDVRWYVDAASNDIKMTEANFAKQSEALSGRIKEAAAMQDKAAEAWNIFYKGEYIPAFEKVSAEAAGLSAQIQEYRDKMGSDFMTQVDRIDAWHTTELALLNKQLADADVNGDVPMSDMIKGEIASLDKVYQERIDSLDPFRHTVPIYEGLVQQLAADQDTLGKLADTLAGYQASVDAATAEVAGLQEKLVVIVTHAHERISEIKGFIDTLTASPDDQIMVLKMQSDMAAKDFYNNMDIFQTALKTDMTADKMAHDVFDKFYQGYVETIKALTAESDSINQAIADYTKKLDPYYQGNDEIARKHLPLVDEINSSIAKYEKAADWVDMLAAMDKLAQENASIAAEQAKWAEQYREPLNQLAEAQRTLVLLNGKIVELEDSYGANKTNVAAADALVAHDQQAIVDLQTGFDATQANISNEIKLVSSGLVEFAKGGYLVGDGTSDFVVHFANGLVGSFTAGGDFVVDGSNSLSMSLPDSFSTDLRLTFNDGGVLNTTGIVTINETASNERPDAGAVSFTALEGKASGYLSDLLANASDKDVNDTLSVTAINGVAVDLSAIQDQIITTVHPADTLIHQVERLVNGIFDILYKGDGVLTGDQTVLAHEYQSQFINALEKMSIEMGDVTGMSIADQLVLFNNLGGAQAISSVQGTLFDAGLLPDSIKAAEQKFIANWHPVDTTTTTEVIPGHLDIPLDGGSLELTSNGRWSLITWPGSDNIIPHHLTFNYTVADNNGAESIGTATINNNNTPVALADFVSLDIATGRYATTWNATENDTDPNADALTVSSVNGLIVCREPLPGFTDETLLQPSDTWTAGIFERQKVVINTDTLYSTDKLLHIPLGEGDMTTTADNCTVSFSTLAGGLVTAAEDGTMSYDASGIIAAARSYTLPVYDQISRGLEQNFMKVTEGYHQVITQDADYWTAVFTRMGLSVGLDGKVSDNFTYNIDDGFGGTATAAAYVTLFNVNDFVQVNPVAHDAALSLNEDGTSFGDLGGLRPIINLADSVTNPGQDILTFALDAPEAAERTPTYDQTLRLLQGEIGVFKGSSAESAVSLANIGRGMYESLLKMSADSFDYLTFWKSDISAQYNEAMATFRQQDPDSFANIRSLVSTIMSETPEAITYRTDNGGIATLHPMTGLVEYTPNGAFDSLWGGETAADSVRFYAKDGGMSNEAILTFNIIGQDSNPLAAADTFSFNASQGLVNANILGNDSAVDHNDTFSLAAINGASVDTLFGTETVYAKRAYYDPSLFPSDSHVFRLESGAFVSLNADGTISYHGDATLAAGATLTDGFDYTIMNDRSGLTADTHVTFNVIGDYVAPSGAVADTYNVDLSVNDSLTGDLKANDIPGADGVVANLNFVNSVDLLAPAALDTSKLLGVVEKITLTNFINSGISADTADFIRSDIANIRTDAADYVNNSWILGYTAQASAQRAAGGTTEGIVSHIINHIYADAVAAGFDIGTADRTLLDGVAAKSDAAINDYATRTMASGIGSTIVTFASGDQALINTDGSFNFVAAHTGLVGDRIDTLTYAAADGSHADVTFNVNDDGNNAGIVPQLTIIDHAFEDLATTLLNQAVAA